MHTDLLLQLNKCEALYTAKTKNPKSFDITTKNSKSFNIKNKKFKSFITKAKNSVKLYLSNTKTKHGAKLDS